MDNSACPSPWNLGFAVRCLQGLDRHSMWLEEFNRLGLHLAYNLTHVS